MNLDIEYNKKRFFKDLFRDIEPDEKIRLLQLNEECTLEPIYFNNIDDLVKYNKNIYNMNTYYQLTTTNGKGQAQNRKYAYCIALDFDKKQLGEEFNHKDIINSCNALKPKLFIHSIVDSGNGYHAYIMINKTDKFDLVEKVTKELAVRLSADKNACKSTQILRVPYTYNVKDLENLKLVKIISYANRNNDKFRAYDIEYLHNKYCEKKAVKDTKIKFELNNNNIPNCLKNILENGSEEGNRYFDLQNIVVLFRGKNKTLSEIKLICKEWAIKSDYNDNIDCKIENIYNNKNHLELNCKNCTLKDSCFNVIVSDFEYSVDEKIITFSETMTGKLKPSTRKGAKTMGGNEILVYSILLNHNDGLTKEELLKELTYTKKKKVVNVALSEKTLRDTLKNLADNGFIEVVKGNKKLGISNIYKIKSIRSKAELTYNISFSATYECVKGNISTEELKLYNYMRFLHHKTQRENSKALKGNLFQMNQSEIAKALDVTQGRISQMIDNLLDEKLLSIWYREPSKNNGFEYYIYRLNY